MSRSRLLLITLSLLWILAACSPQNNDFDAETDAVPLLNDSIDNLRGLASFRIDIEQGGTPYRFNFQMGPDGFLFETFLTEAQGAYIAPDRLWANSLISIRGALVNIGLFATSDGQWLKPLSSNWLEFVYAEGFNPAEMMVEGGGFQTAIDRMEEVEFIGQENRNGVDVLHVRGLADGDTVNALLFGLLSGIEGISQADIYIDVETQIPNEILLTLLDSAEEDNENTFWRIEIYDLNANIELDRPEAVPPLEVRVVSSEPPFNIMDYLGWILGFSALMGAVVTPIVFHNKNRSGLLGLLAGAISGGIGSLFLLLPLWFFVSSGEGKTDENSQVPQQATASQLAKVNPWVVIAFISIPVFVGSLDLTVVSAFLPELVSEIGLPFDTGLDDAAWIVTSYLLAYTVSLTFMGRLSDLVGRRVVYVACLLVFIIGSVWVAIAHSFPTDLLFQIYRRMGLRPDIAYVNLHVIIIGRVISALGAGALVPVSMALVGDIFAPDKRARPLGFIAAMDTLGWVLGPVYGGIFMQVMPWQGLFWVNVPLTLLALFSVLYALRHVPVFKVVGRFDYLGTVLIVAALSAMSIGLGSNVDLSSGNASIEDLRPLPEYAPLLLTMAVILFLAFLFVERRIKDPLINLGMFKRRNLWSASLVNLLIGYCLFIGLVSVPLLVNMRQESESLAEAALQVGLLLSTLTLPMAAAALPGGWLSDRFGTRNTILLGLVLATGGFLVMWQTWAIDMSNLFLSLQMAVVGIGIGLTFSPVSTAIINSAYDEERGVASALVIILRLIGMTVSISTLSSIMLYRVNALVAEANSALETFDGSALVTIYTESTVKILGEMGLIGAILAGLAIIPALFISQTVSLPDEDKMPT
ncbi:MAG: MFS transporter [Anaerolineae bacterium]|nr:MFS transporter [Anaerolineae bacterium]